MSRRASDQFAKKLLAGLIRHGRCVILVWMRCLHGSAATGSSSQEWTERVDAAAHDVFCRARIDELFDIIHEFPDSEPAVLELRTALTVTQQHGLLASVLRNTLQRRLLHPVGGYDHIFYPSFPPSCLTPIVHSLFHISCMLPSFSFFLMPVG